MDFRNEGAVRIVVDKIRLVPVKAKALQALFRKDGQIRHDKKCFNTLPYVG